MIKAVKVTRIQGTDGCWYTPRGGMPLGIKWNGQTKTYWALTRNGATFGQFETEHEATLEANLENSNVSIDQDGRVWFLDKYDTQEDVCYTSVETYNTRNDALEALYNKEVEWREA